MSNRSFEDVTLRAEVDCGRACDFGVLLNAQQAADGWTGLYVRVTPEGIALGTATVSPTGSLVRFDVNERQGSGFGRTLEQNGTQGPPRPGRSGPPPADARPAPGPPARPAIVPREGKNRLEVIVDGDTFSAVLNGRRLPVFLAPLRDGRGYGPVLLAARGQGLGIETVELRDGLVRAVAPTQTQKPFVERRLNSAYIAEAITYGDFDKDKILDVAVGPYWYKGPNFTEVHEVYLAPPLGPMDVSSSYQAFAHDFTGDGYDDIVQAATPGQPASFYVNPGADNRRWAKYQALTGLSTETMAAGDVDGDGRPELVLGQSGRLVIASPDPAGADRPWLVQPISPTGWRMSSHGSGIADIDGDGRADLLVSNGWWQQPAGGIAGTWTFHPVAFGNAGPDDGSGATAQMFAYDVDGDGLNDVVTALEAHGWGIGWFKQVRGAGGTIDFVRHEIMGDDWARGKAPVFSEPHAFAVGDIDKDGLVDLVAGKRWWAHRDGPKDPDATGPAVLYWFKLVRDRKGGARFEPQLINNDSGVGTSISVADLNGDGRPEVMTANRKGAFVFLNKP